MAGYNDQRELLNDPEEAIRAALSGFQRGMWTSLPVIVVEDSTDGHTVKLKSAVKVPRLKEDGTTDWIELPTFESVPVKFAGAGGVTSTHAIKKGDEGFIDFASRNLAGWHGQGGVQDAPDQRMHSLSDASFRPGARSDPRKIPDYNTEASEARTDDGKHRTITHPNNGVKVTVNGGKQVLDVNAATNQIQAVAKTLSLKAGTPTPGGPVNTADTTSRDLNEMLKGLAAHVTQIKDSHHALFDVVSKLRTNVEAVVPTLVPLNIATQVTMALSGQPTGLDAMKALASGKLQDYFQTALKTALQDFLNPARVLGAASVLGGGLEGLIQALTARLEALIAQNPAVAAVDALQHQADAVLARGASAAVTAAQMAPIRDAIAALVADNPAVGLAQNLRAQLQGLVGQAGPGIDFLGPQQRLVKGVVQSFHLSEG